LTRPRWRDVSQRQGISIQIHKELDPKLPSLLSEPSDLREALINLIFNAVDALPQGGAITLATRCLEAPQTSERSGPDRLIQVEVRDNGVGMDERIRQRCLEPFFSTKAQRGGTGLGLAMVYGMMQRHEGSIQIESTPEVGTCIRLAFPLREAAVANPVGVAPLPLTRRSLRILCIDDEPQVRLLMKDCLARLGHVVNTASSGKEGVEVFDAALRSDSAYHIVITDLGMPDLDGHQVARSIKAASPQTPIVMLTGWGRAMKHEGESAPEISAVVGKPPSIGDLNELLLKLTSPTRVPVLSPQMVG